ncbi:hypothetical protein PHYPSEUDO_005398 [Phytophthora pseudosyringae]|uniref:Survival motor neuron Tudor domain-containing protein n=1 Tax=Phytophthora pseudosyringae TaxID=221518 RepID=A0A8T1VRE2_9STRA|nr:hypothetical protein PHYPSEUDO_005398 [Phytophthora pseudosyringae]
MASTVTENGSEQGSEAEQWDDMAIVRVPNALEANAAFEEALTDQRTRNSASAKPTGRKHKAAARSNGKKAARSVSIEEDEDEEEEQRDEYGHQAAASGAAAGVGQYGQPNAAAYAGYGSNPFVYQQQQQQHSSSDAYQAAYAQAYAQLHAQFQGAYPAASTPQPYGPGAQMPAFPAQSPYYPPPPPIPSMPMPFSAMPGAAAPFPGSASDDALANMLMAWYQSGYYTGRFQAMQEMKTRGRR